jgi:hypothetical protein
MFSHCVTENHLVTLLGWTCVSQCYIAVRNAQEKTNLRKDLL